MEQYCGVHMLIQLLFILLYDSVIYEFVSITAYFLNFLQAVASRGQYATNPSLQHLCNSFFSHPYFNNILFFNRPHWWYLRYFSKFSLYSYRFVTMWMNYPFKFFSILTKCIFCCSEKLDFWWQTVSPALLDHIWMFVLLP